MPIGRWNKRGGAKLLVFATSNRDGVPTQIASDILPFFTEHLDVISYAEKISLLLITNGGDTMTAWNLVNLIKSFCSNFEVIVPFNCFSAGTLICLGANNIVMTKQATLHLTTEVIELLKPGQSVISCRGSKKLPNPAIVHYLSKYGKVFSTSKSGTLTYSSVTPTKPAMPLRDKHD